MDEGIALVSKKSPMGRSKKDRPSKVALREMAKCRKVLGLPPLPWRIA